MQQITERITEPTMGENGQLDEKEAIDIAEAFYKEKNYKEAVKYYEMVFSFSKIQLSLIDYINIVYIGHLCVSYIMVSENYKTERIFSILENKQYLAINQDPKCKFYQACVVKCLVGTLYCNVNNIEFGLGILIPSFEPFKTVMGGETWVYAKIVLLDLLKNKFEVLKTKEREVNNIL